MMRRHFGISYATLKIFCLFSPRFPSEFFSQNFLPMSGVFWCMADENWFVFEFVCWIRNISMLWKHLESFQAKFFSANMKNQSRRFPAELVLLVYKNLKSLMMRIQTHFIDFQWWWKSLKMSKYWSLQLKMNNHSYFVSFTNEICRIILN